MKGCIGRKIGMSRIFEGNGTAVPVTLVECGPCPVIQVKTAAKDGYAAVQLGFGAVREKGATKPLLSHCKKAGVGPVRVIKEFRLDSAAEMKPGQMVGVEIFENVKSVDVVGISKGRGFTGTIKRYHFQRGRETHGNKNHRAPGSAGNHTYPARTWPGKKLPGHHGDARITVKNLQLIDIDKEKNLLVLRGAIPGPTNGFVFMSESAKRKG